jgi:hypothetical protein
MHPLAAQLLKCGGIALLQGHRQGLTQLLLASQG